jgi:phytoene dehydrogenase-like protein
MQQSTGTSNGVAVVGGGLAGLSAAALLGRAGRPVVVYEKASELGGRARTQAEQGFEWNLGPHALYAAGPAAQTFKTLGVAYSGRKPTVGGFVLDRGTKHTLPGGLVSLLTTRFFGLGAKMETGKLLGALPRVDAKALASVSIGDWLAREVAHEDVRRFVAALCRLSTYANSPDQSAEVALGNLQLAVSEGVLYLDHGWQTLVDGLRAAAVAAGVRFENGARVATVRHDDRVRGVRLADGREATYGAVIMTGGPADVAALPEWAGATPLAAWEAAARPVKAACLDVALARLPVAGSTFALGIDEPVYASVHTAFAKLAPGEGAVVHLAKYLPVGVESDPKADERTLEHVLDLLQPGWKDVLVARRFLPQLVVSHALVTATGGSLAGRPGPAVPGVGGLYVAGDWVGREGLLADASVGSAAEAARLVLEDRVRAAA